MEFERPIFDLEKQIDELKKLAGDQQLSVDAEIAPLERKLNDLRAEVYKNLSPLQRVQVARNSKRPFTLDYIRMCFTDFVELHGDRLFREDPAIVGGWARLDGETVMVVGQQRGRDTKENLKRNFGMPHPEGYRKALRLMRMAERFQIPLITFIDTSGAYPGVGAEERGQSEAIARNLFEMARLRVPVVSAVIGEGGSGGALAIGVCDRLLMLQYSVYSVISPEGCASILWKSADKKELAAEAMGITADRIAKLGLVDEVLREPLGGAHRDPQTMAEDLKAGLLRHLDAVGAQSTTDLLAARHARLRSQGVYQSS